MTSGATPRFAGVIKEVKDVEESIPKIDDARQEVYMTMAYMHGKVAAAFFEVEKTQVSLFSEVVDKDKEFAVTQSLIQAMQPVAVILSKKSHQGFKEVVVESMKGFKTPEQITTLLSTDITFDERSASKSSTPASSRTPVVISKPENDSGTTVSGSSTSDSAFKTPLPVDRQEDSEEDNPRKKTKNEPKLQPFLDKLSDNVVSISAKCFLPDQEYIFRHKASGVFSGKQLLDDQSNASKSALLSAKINFEEEVTVRCLVALLWFIDRVGIRVEDVSDNDEFTVPSNLTSTTGRLNRVSNEATFGATTTSSRNSDPFMIRRVSYFFLPSLVFVNDNSLRALQVISEEQSPSTRTLQATKKNRLSLLTMFSEECQSRPGKFLLKKILSQPIRDKTILSYRYSVIEFFSQEKMKLLGDDLMTHMKDISALNAVFRRLQMTEVKFNDIKTLYNTVVKLTEVALYMSETEGLPAALTEKAKQLNTKRVVKVMDMIRKTIDFESTAKDPNKTIRFYGGVSAELDDCYQAKGRVSEMLSMAVEEEARAFEMQGIRPPNFKVIFMEGPGFLLQMPLQDPQEMMRVHNAIVIAGGEQVLENNRNCIFYKTTLLKQLDDEVRSKIMMITYLEVEILSDLREDILDSVADIDQLADFSSELEVLLAFTRVSCKNGWTKPEINDMNNIEIKNGRHPLLESLIPNDYLSVKNKIKIITGPNASGKSVYMKQICLITHLALCGSFVPADHASIPLVDKMITRVKSEESHDGVSSFMADLKQINSAIDNATHKSLVIIDEFGKGTHPDDGIALLAACIRFFMKETQPHVMIATHFHSVIKLLDEKNPLLHFLQFKSQYEGEGKFVHDFSIKEGIADSSIPQAVYRDVGLPERLVNRCEEVLQALKTRNMIKPNYSEKQVERNQVIDQVCQAFLNLNTESRMDVKNFFEAYKKVRHYFE